MKLEKPEYVDESLPRGAANGILGTFPWRLGARP